MRANIENAILSTFLDINELNENLEYVYKLDISIFSTPLRKRVAEKINSVDDNSYGFLSYTLEESIKGTTHESDWLDIISQNSLGLRLSKKYHGQLVSDDSVSDLI